MGGGSDNDDLTGARLAKSARRKDGLGSVLLGGDKSFPDGLLAVDVVFEAARFSDVLDADMNTLDDVTVADGLLDLNTNGTRGDVPDSSGTTVVELEGHALVDGGIGNNVDIVADLVDVHVVRKMGDSMFAEFAMEESTSASAITVTVRHCLSK